MSLTRILEVPADDRSVVELETVAIRESASIQSVVRSVEQAHHQSRLLLGAEGGPSVLEWDDGTRQVLGLHYDDVAKHKITKNGSAPKRSAGSKLSKNALLLGTISKADISEIDEAWTKIPELSFAFEYEWKTLTLGGFKVTSGAEKENEFVSMFLDGLNHDLLGNLLCDAERHQFKYGFVVLAVPVSPLQWATYDMMPFDEWIEAKQPSKAKGGFRKRPMTSHARLAKHPGLIYGMEKLPCRVIHPNEGVLSVVSHKGDVHYEFDYQGRDRDSFSKKYRFIVCPSMRDDVRPNRQGQLQSAVHRIVSHHKRYIMPMEELRTHVASTRAQALEFCNTEIPLRDERNISSEDRSRIDRLRRHQGSLGETEIDLIVNTMMRGGIYDMDATGQELFLSSFLTADQIEEVKSHIKSEKFGAGSRRLDRVLLQKNALESYQERQRNQDLSKTSYSDWDAQMIKNYNRADHSRDDVAKVRIRYRGAVKHVSYIAPEFNLAERDALMGEFRTFIAQTLMLPENLLYTKASGANGSKQASNSMSAADGALTMDMAHMAVEHLERDCIGLFDFIYRESLGPIYNAGVQNIYDALNVMGMDALSNLNQRQLYVLMNGEQYEPVLNQTNMTFAQRLEEMARGHVLVKDDLISQWVLEHYHSILKLLFIIETAHNVSSTHIRIAFAWKEAISKMHLERQKSQQPQSAAQ